MGKYRDRMEQDLALRGAAKTTAEAYLKYARKFIMHFGRSAEHLGTEHVRSWLLWMLRKGNSARPR
jgi:hypothetical protein